MIQMETRAALNSFENQLTNQHRDRRCKTIAFPDILQPYILVMDGRIYSEYGIYGIYLVFFHGEAV